MSAVRSPEPAESERLARALAEIARVELYLRATGDTRTLSGFADADAGTSIAASLGHDRLAAADARIVAQLMWLPGGHELVREYLRRGAPAVPRPAARVRRAPARGAA